VSISYQLNDVGIHLPDIPVFHRDDEYDQAGFDVLWDMQSRHFWYLGRHRFILYALKRHLSTSSTPGWAIDLGGGCGGWIKYLSERAPERFSRLALADSSLIALERAGSILPKAVERYQIDLMNLGWENQWDVAFLLDVLEHIPDDVTALQQAGRAIKPGALIFATAPALQLFWSDDDKVAHHLRRYARKDFVRLADESGLILRDARYFMFFLSPLYWLARLRSGAGNLSDDKKHSLFLQAHRVSEGPSNKLLSVVFESETPIGHWLSFPWGTSILAVLEKPVMNK